MCASGNCAVAWVSASRDSAEPSTGTKIREDILYGSLRNYKIALSMRASIRPLDHEDRDIDRSKHGGGNTAEKLPLEIRPTVRTHDDEIDFIFFDVFTDTRSRSLERCRPFDGSLNG